MNLLKQNKDKNGVSKILRQSTRAVCGIQEREVNVPRDKVASTIKTLKKGGFFIVGKSHGDTKIKKIWFNPVGGF